MRSTEKDIKDFLLSVLKEMSDPDYQERIWIQGKGPEVSSAGELFCNFFDDLDIPEIVENYTDYDMTHSQSLLLQELYHQMDEYSQLTPISIEDADVLADSRWHKICIFAKKVYNDLSNPHEK